MVKLKWFPDSNRFQRFCLCRKSCRKVCIDVCVCVHAWLHVLWVVNECVIVLVGLGGQIKGRPHLTLELAFITVLRLNWKCNTFHTEPLPAHTCGCRLYFWGAIHTVGGAPRRKVYSKSKACFITLLILWRLKYAAKRSFELSASVSA